ncbi:hypothetical protein CB0940_05172 [Cercospora beticola]|uniref:Secreted protein n=1 Tax=Cercospora beticola TaxID=122368 RepID=A0A2G5HMQ1_CERBT|nr:hypothetical protein CB0940_05172 [Cercospora beticola]PIA93831.1 hypothetical protein CB0940_05172 [Cercospora beticola]
MQTRLFVFSTLMIVARVRACVHCAFCAVSRRPSATRHVAQPLPAFSCDDPLHRMALRTHLRARRTNLFPYLVLDLGPKEEGQSNFCVCAVMMRDSDQSLSPKRLMDCNRANGNSRDGSQPTREMRLRGFFFVVLTGTDVWSGGVVSFREPVCFAL